MIDFNESIFILKFKNDLIYKKENMIMEEDFNVNNPTKENIDYALKKKDYFFVVFFGLVINSFTFFIIM